MVYIDKYLHYETYFEFSSGKYNARVLDKTRNLAVNIPVEMQTVVYKDPKTGRRRIWEEQNHRMTLDVAKKIISEQK